MYLHWNHKVGALAIAGILGIAIALASCKKGDDDVTDPDPVHDPTPAELEYPSWFPEMPVSEDNPMTVEGIQLGRKLYYDPLLHPQGTNSCSSCHAQESSFSIPAPGTAVLAHVNLGWSSTFLWNGKIEGTMEDIMLFEVEEFFQTDVSRLQQNDDYPDLFEEAFGERTITTEHCAMALAQFFRSMISANSRFDRYYPGTIQPTQAEERGYLIFNTEKGDCFHCHIPPLFTDNLFHNIGLDSTFTAENVGRAEVTGNERDHAKFKTPTLRNVALTAPYMHDGRFQTLEEVIDHYDHGVKESNSLDPIMSKPGKGTGLQLSDQEKADLLAFLKSLTDTSYTQNPNLSNPW